MTSLGSYYDVPAGLGGVRALAGLGCGCAGGQPSSAVNGLGALTFLKSPLGVGLMLTLGVVGFILIRESVR